MEVITNQKTYRNYLFFLGGQFFSILGSSIVQFVIIWWITVETENVMYLSFGAFLFFLPMAIITPFAGVITDRWNKKSIIMVVDSLQAMVTFCIIILFFFNITNPLFIVLINSLRGIFQAFHIPTVNAIIPSMVPKDKLSRINGVNYLSSSISRIAGPLMGATLLAFFPIRLILWFDIITYLVALFPLLIIDIPKFNKPKENETFWHDFKVGLNTIKSIPGFLGLLLMFMCGNFLITPLRVLMPYFVKVTHNGTAFDLALITISINIGTVLGGLITSIKKKWKHKLFINFGGEFVVLTGFMIFAFVPREFFLLMLIGAFTIGLLFPFLNTIYMTIVHVIVPQDKIGRVVSFDYALSFALLPISSILAGPLAEIFGVTTLFFFLPLIGMIITILIYKFTKVRMIFNIDTSQEINF